MSEGDAFVLQILGLSLVLSQTAWADIPPPSGQHWIATDVVFDKGIADHTLVIYPWSNSNGRPMAQMRVVTEGSRISFGRRISGMPQLYAVPTSEWTASPLSEAAPPEGTVNEETVAFLARKGLHCQWSHTPTRMGPTSKPARKVERLVALLEDGACVTRPAGSATPAADGNADPSASEAKPVDPVQPAATSGSDAGCSVVPVSSSLGLLVALLVSRRRRE